MISGAWQRTGSGISGWAKSDVLASPVWVELLAGGEVMGIARADLPEPYGCGFWLPLPDALFSDETELKLRIANSEILLPGEEHGLREQTGGQLCGDLAVDRGLLVSGWVLDSDYGDKKLAVHAWIDDKKVAETIAAERRYRPPQADGHGFSLELPHEYADGKSHTVSILDDKKRHVPGSPFRIRTLAQNAACWLGNQKKLDKPLLGAVQGLLETMEERLPGAMSLSRYEVWKKAFPVAMPQGRQKANYGILANTEQECVQRQQGIELTRNDAKADFYLLASPGTRLHPGAIGQMYRQLKDHGAAIVYADSEDQKGQPQFKPCWDSEGFFASDYLGAILINPDTVRRAGLLRHECVESARLKLIMAAENNILHVPGLYSRDGEAQSESRRKQAVQGWLIESTSGAILRASGVGWPLVARPKVSIVIPTRDQAELLQRCLTSLDCTDWPDYEIIIVDNGTTDEDALAVLRNAAGRGNCRVLERPGVFNYAYLNNSAVKEASGELVCFLNNDAEALHPEWLSELAAPLLAAGSSGGASGAKLLWPNGLVQHGGVIVGTHQLAAHAGNRWLEDEPGYMNRNQIAQQFSAVTAACMLTPRALFLESGGFDERRFPVAFNDVDYCLRLRAKGKRIFWTPESRLAHHESASRGKESLPSAKARADREMSFFRKIWGHYEDPFYNPNLSLSALCEPFHGLAFPPRPREAR